MASGRRIDRRPCTGALLPPGESGGAGFIVVLLILLAVAAGLYYYKKTGRPAQVDEVSLPSADLDAGSGLELKADSAPLIADDEVQDTGVDPLVADASRAYNEGTYDRAVALLREAYARTPSSGLVRSALAKSLNRAALGKFSSGDYRGAREMLEEASGLSPDDVVLENLASVQIRLDDLKGAASTLEKTTPSSSSRKTLYNIYVRLGTESYNAGDASGALSYYEKASAIGPSDARLSSAIESLRKETAVESGMGRTDNRHFVVKYEGGENAVAGHLIGLLLEEAYAKVGADLGYYPEDRIEAVLYSRENFRDITRSPSWAGAIYDGRIKVPAGGVTEKTDALERVLFHEYTHALVHRLSSGRAPTWLNEGIAQYEEGGSSAQYSDELAEAAGAGVLRLRALEGSFMSLGPQSARAAYIVSLSATEYIIREFGIFSVKKIFENLSAGMSVPEAIQSAVYLSYDDLERSWLESLKR